MSVKPKINQHLTHQAVHLFHGKNYLGAVNSLQFFDFCLQIKNLWKKGLLQYKGMPASNPPSGYKVRKSFDFGTQFRNEQDTQSSYAFDIMSDGTINYSYQMIQDGLQPEYDELMEVLHASRKIEQDLHSKVLGITYASGYENL